MRGPCETALSVSEKSSVRGCAAPPPQVASKECNNLWRCHPAIWEFVQGLKASKLVIEYAAAPPAQVSTVLYSSVLYCTVLYFLLLLRSALYCALVPAQSWAQGLQAGQRVCRAPPAQVSIVPLVPAHDSTVVLVPVQDSIVLLYLYVSSVLFSCACRSGL